MVVGLWWVQLRLMVRQVVAGDVRGVEVGRVSVGEPRPDAIGVVGPVGLGVACAEGAPYVSRTCWNASRRYA